MHTAAFLLGQGLVISVNTVILGWLLWDARAVPRALAALGIAGGVIVLVSNGLQLAGAIPLNGVAAGVAAVPVFAFEIWFAVWLIAVGVRSEPGIRAAHEGLPFSRLEEAPGEHVEQSDQDQRCQRGAGRVQQAEERCLTAHSGACAVRRMRRILEGGRHWSSCRGRRFTTVLRRTR
jgi:hypothetical protein